MPKMLVSPQYDGIIKNVTSKNHLLIRLQAPKLPQLQTSRNPINISIVLDRSGSMSGRPLQEAKKCAERIIDSLLPTDKASIIAYADKAETMAKLTSIKNKKQLKNAIRNINEQGMTALFAGWNTGAKTLPTTETEISRVLLLSDGQANRGVTDIPTIEQAVAEYAEKGITTSTYGLGTHFNEELMIKMATSGGGNAYYGETAADLMDPFMEEFELLSNLYIKNIRLKIESHNNIQLSIRNLYPQDDSGNTKLPSLAYDSETWLLVEYIVPKENTMNTNSIDLASVSIQYQDMDGNEHYLEKHTISLPIVSQKVFALLVENEVVKSRKQEIRAAEITEQARDAIKIGDSKKVRLLLEEAKSNAQNNPWLENIVETIENMLKKGLTRESSLEMDFTTSRLRSRLAAVGEQIDDLKASRSYLRRKTRQGKKG